ncbi:MAG: RNA pyrophosphohydrolase [Coxiella sp. RIFCSPHIGHO2_12_FULL_42_15]|nr:MAG: RNA pyrophosphohydrolase [Coxiella sp. RIFCSPHIGHO2_12_FULL_42_15]
MSEMGVVMNKVQVDEQGYRCGVGMIILNRDNHVFWARRHDHKEAWQFPQGGIHLNENVRHALYRELLEEVGLRPEHVAVIAESKQWLTYRLPYGKQDIEGQKVAGQRQKWFLLRLLVEDEKINLHTTPKPEFNAWRWVEYWEPLTQIVAFKREVYQQILAEFADYL